MKLDPTRDEGMANDWMKVEVVYLPSLWILEGEFTFASRVGAAVHQSGEHFTVYVRMHFDKCLRY